MRTVTIEAVLGPVAEAIGELFIANEDAEINDISLGDLSPMAEAVGISVQGLLDVASSLVTSTADEELRIEMPLACQEVEDAVDNLKSSTKNLKTDPMNPVERRRMIDAAKGILTGTRKVLECFDDYEVRKIVRACDDATREVQSLKRVETVEQLVAVIQPACQSLIVLAQLADKRVSELLDPWLKASLTQAKDIIKGSSALLVSSVKTYVTNNDKPSRASANESRNLCVDRLLKSIKEVREIVQVKQAPPIDEVVKVSDIARSRAAVRDAMLDIHQAVRLQNPEALAAAFKIFNPATDQILKNAREIANGLQDKAKAAQIKESIAKIEKLRKDLEAAAKYALEHPNDAAAQQRLIDIMRETDAEFARLDKLLNEALMDDINSSLAMLVSGTPHSIITKMVEAAHAGDLNGVNNYAKKFEEEARNLRKLADDVANRSTDPEKIRAIREAQKFLDDLYPQVIAAARTVALNPDDPAAREHLRAVVAEWETGVNRLKKAIEDAQTNEEIIASQTKALRSDLDKFEEACRTQNVELLKEASAGMTSKIQSATAAAQREIDNSDDPVYQQTVKAKLGEIQRILPEIQNKAKLAFANPKDEKAQNELKATNNLLMSKMNELKDIVHEHHNPKENEKWAEMQKHVEETKRKEEERKRREEEMKKKSEAEKAAMKKAEEEAARKAAEEEEAYIREQETMKKMIAEQAKSNPIKAAALRLKVEANKWDAEGNSMIAASQSLADQLAQLSEFAKMSGPDAKRNLINAAKKIAEEAKRIEAQAREVANNCSDKRLKGDLITTCERINTIASQIKILATVKAANPDDMDNDQMLVTACNNLVSSVQKTIESSQAAQIRSFASTANTVVAAMKWKKKALGGKSSEPKSLATLMTNTKIK